MAKKSEAGGDKAKGKPASKAEALRWSLEANGWDAPLDTHEQFLKSQYGITMSRMQISQYKSAEARRQGKRRRRRRKTSAAADDTGRPQTPRDKDLLTFVSTVRQWEDKLGSKKLLEVINALYKQS